MIVADTDRGTRSTGARRARVIGDAPNDATERRHETDVRRARSACPCGCGAVCLRYRRAVRRIDPDTAGDELTSLSQFLDFHRATLVIKVSGLSSEQLAARAVPSSAITLGGMLKHLALVEDDWFQVKFLGRPELEPWASAPFDVDPDWDWHSAVDDTPDDLLRLYDAACTRSRAAVVEVGGDLDRRSAVTDPRTGATISLRWILLHMIEETARHNGHADLLREAIDGSVGE